MSVAIIKLRPIHLIISNPYPEVLEVLSNIHSYKSSLPIETMSSGKAGAEEMFCLTNDPSCQEERDLLYSGRSVSVGDVVEVDSISFICSAVGWKEIGKIVI
jgi:hypothetical protein